MTRKIFMTLFVILAMAVNAAYSAQPYAQGNSVVLEATGRGLTKTAAKIDARRNAAQQALGFLLEGSSLYTSLIQDSHAERSISEKVIRISRAFIGAGEEVLRESKSVSGVFTVTLRVKVSGSELLNGLLQRGNQETSPLDGASMVASAMSREQWKKETGDALAEVFGNFPVNDYVRVSAQTVGDFDLRSSELRLRIHMKFDRERYFAEAVPQMLAVLDYVSDARMIDVPFMLPLERVNDDTVSITLPSDIRAIRQYISLMEIEAENRVIRPGGYANVYIQSRDYYFNAYRINPDAFIKLANTLFAADSRGRLSTKQGYCELNISFAGGHGQRMDFPPVGLRNMNNIMFFMDTVALSRYPLSAGKYDEGHNALFIIPAFAFEDKDGKDYTLYQEDSGDIPAIKVSAEELIGLGKGSMQCSVTFK